MSVCYFLGVKSIKSKKSGKEFFPANFLTRDNWGNWTVLTRFCADESVYEDIVDNVLEGSPVLCSLDLNNSLVKCVPHDSVPALVLPEE